jgi:hypothetical protein
MHDDENHYWAAAPNAPMPSQPAYNSFMYPAPPINVQAQAQPHTHVQTTWAPHHSNPMGTYEEHIPSIHFQSDPYPPMPTHEHAVASWMGPPPTTMPDMIIPGSPSSEGTHSPAPSALWTLPPMSSEWAAPVPYGGHSMHSSPAGRTSELLYAPSGPGASWTFGNDFSSNTMNSYGHATPSPVPSLYRSRSASDGELSFGDHSFAPGTAMPTSSISSLRRHSASFEASEYSTRHDPYVGAHSARCSPHGSRVASPIRREVTRSPMTLIDDTDASSVLIAKAVVTTDPVSEASARRRTHEARFECDLCGKRLTTKTNLEGHRKSHLGVKEFMCGVCDKPFTRDWDRKRHERTHTKGSELTCNVCGKKSTRKDAFDKHRTYSHDAVVDPLANVFLLIGCRAPGTTASTSPKQASTSTLPYSF